MIESTVEGRYHVIGRIASGGMGEVFKARDDVLGREVALKVLHPQLAGDHGFIERFRREARAAAILNHPNVVGVYDWSSTDGTYFMVMEFVRGQNLRSLLDGFGRLEPAQAADICVQVLSALDHAHGHGIVHRDMKPENILIAQDGRVKVADFGLARAFADASVSHAQGMVTGTVHYLAPEQIKGEPADPRTDLYGLGVVMFELLTGRPPFAGETSLAIAYAHLSDRVPAPSSVVAGIPPALDRIVLWATQKERTARPRSARALQEELTRARADLPSAPAVAAVASQAPSKDPLGQEPGGGVVAPRRAAPRTRRKLRIRTVFAVLALVAALAAGIWATWVYAVPHYTTVPRLAGLSLRAASARLANLGLEARVGVARFSASVEAGRVIRSRPAAGTTVREGAGVTLIPSNGPPLVAVPSLVGDPGSSAERELFRLGLEVEREDVFDEGVPAGHVVSQTPDAGLELERGSTVTITVSKGPPPVEIPAVAERPAAEATETLHDVGFAVVETQEHSTSVPRGEVIRTEPDAGDMATKGSTITVVVSLGPRTFAIPDVVGTSLPSAIDRLEDLGLVVRQVPLPGTTGETVVFQEPSAGTTVREGQEVTIVTGD